MKNTTITIIIVTLLLCIAGFGVWTMTNGKPLESNTKPANPTAENANVMAVTSNTLANAGNPSASEMLAEFSKRKPGEVAQVIRKPPTREELKKRKQEWIARDMKNRRNELNSKNVIYSALYDRLKLPNQKLNILKDLLVELEFADSIVSVDYLVSGSPSDAIREASSLIIVGKNRAFRSEIGWLSGSFRMIGNRARLILSSVSLS